MVIQLPYEDPMQLYFKIIEGSRYIVVLVLTIPAI
jgi:hypothetical protein